jgi:hypothetical protein
MSNDERRETKHDVDQRPIEDGFYDAVRRHRSRSVDMVMFDWESQEIKYVDPFTIRLPEDEKVIQQSIMSNKAEGGRRGLRMILFAVSMFVAGALLARIFMGRQVDPLFVAPFPILVAALMLPLSKTR